MAENSTTPENAFNGMVDAVAKRRPSWLLDGTLKAVQENTAPNENIPLLPSTIDTQQTIVVHEEEGTKTILMRPKAGAPEAFVTQFRPPEAITKTVDLVPEEPPAITMFRRAGNGDRITEVGRVKKFTANLLVNLVGIQKNLSERIGNDELTQKNKSYFNAVDTYVSICKKLGLERDVHIKMIADVRVRSDEKIEQQLIYKERIFASVLSRPFDILDQKYSTEASFNEHVLTPLGLDDTYTIDTVLERIMTDPDPDTIVAMLAGNDDDLKIELKNAITHHRILGTALSNQFHWRKFTEILMNGNDQESRRRGRFSTETGFMLHGDEQIHDLQQRAQKILESISIRGTKYYLTSEEDEIVDTPTGKVTKRIKHSVPVYTPFSLLKDKKGKNNPTYPPKIAAEFNGKRVSHEGVTALLEIVEKDEDGPGSMIAFANNKNNILAKNEMCYSDVPMVLRLTKYKNGEMYATVISDHSVTDGEPEARDILERFVRELGYENTKIPFMPPRATEDEFENVVDLLNMIPDDLSSLPSFSEITAPLASQGIFEFRKFLKDARQNGIDIVDQENVPIDLSEYGLGTLCTLIYGNIMLTNAKGMNITDDDAKLGGIGALEEINQQLLQANLDGLELPNKMAEWFTITPPEKGNKGKIQLGKEFSTRMHTANMALRTVGSSRDATQIVRDVYGLSNEFLWRVNAYSASKFLSKIAAGSTGRVMISDVYTWAKASPALAEWQHMALTLSALDNGYMAATAKMRETEGNMKKGLETLRAMILQTYNFNARVREFITRQREYLQMN